jgi:4-carboxymuconolactone decarboxylase
MARPGIRSVLVTLGDEGGPEVETSEGPERGRSAEPGLDPGLRALVRLSAEVALGSDADFAPVLDDALAEADPIEVEEALIQSYLFVGYPGALNAIAAWRLRSGMDAPPGDEDRREDWASRGVEVCEEVYGSAYPPLRTNISTLRPELDRWMVEEGYGKVLGRPGLALWRRECCIVAILAVLGAGPQLRSHLRGALRTGTAVATLAEVLDAVEATVPEHRRGIMSGVWDRVRTRWEEG